METKAPNGYDQLTEPIPFEIEEGKASAVEIVVENEKSEVELCEYFEIRGEDEAGEEIVSIVVKDENGEVVKESDSDSITLDRETIPAGKYTVEVTTEDGRSVTEEVEIVYEEECAEALVLTVPSPELCESFEIRGEDEAGEEVVSIVVKDENGEVVKESDTDSITLDRETISEGSYTVEVTTEDGRSVTEEVEVVYEEECAEAIVLTVPAPELCESFEIRGEDEAGEEIVSIVVKDENGEVVKESDSDSITLDRETIPAGKYTVEVTTEDGRSVTEEVEVVYEEECADALVLTVPAPELCESFEIRGEDEAGEEIVSIVVKDENGEVVKESDSDSITLDRETVSEGSYTVEVTTEDGRSVTEEVEVVYEEECGDAFVITVPESSNDMCENVNITITENGKPSKDEKYTFTSKDGQIKVTVTTDDNGKAKVSRDKLPNGTYIVTDSEGNEIGEVIVTDDCIVNLNIETTTSVEEEEPEKEDVPEKETGTSSTPTQDGTDLGSTEGEKLPSTATQVFNLLTIGLGILLIGFTVLFISRKRKEEA